MKRPCLQLRPTLLWTLPLIILFAFFLKAASKRDLPSQLAEFYVVEVWDADFYPYWQTSILHVLRENNGVKLVYMYLASATQPCDEPKLEGINVMLPASRIEDLTKDLDLCALDPTSFNERVDKYNREPALYSTTRSAVVARCGAEDRVFHLPLLKMDLKSLKVFEPSARPMSQLGQKILQRAFPHKGGIDSNLKQIPPESAEVEEIKKGHYDNGYWFGFQGAHPAIPAQVIESFDPTMKSDSDLGKLRNTLGRYKHIVKGPSGGTVLLVSSERFKLHQYTAPIYGPLAYQIGLKGPVQLSLSVDQDTGRVVRATRESGNELLAASAQDAAMKWQFEPAPSLPKTIRVALDFSIPCGP